MITPRTAATTRLSTRTRSALVVAVMMTLALIGSAAAQAPVSTFGLGSSQLREAQLVALPLALAALPSSDLTRESFVTPLPGHTRLSSGFGWRNLAVNGNRFHAGIDLPAAPGTPVRAARDGVVVRAGWWGTYGYAVAVDHQDGSETRYAHLSAFSVAAGETVRQGDVIGAVGSTGASTGPHLHFELRFDERAVDPTAYLDNDPLRAGP